jgi:hypothetical protein
MLRSEDSSENLAGQQKQIDEDIKRDGLLSINMGNTIRRGILLKRARSKLFTPWYLRTVVVTDRNKLFYFDDTKLKGVVSLRDAVVRVLPPEEAGGKPFGFEIGNIPTQRRSQENRLILVAGSDQERNEWFSALSAAAHAQSTRGRGDSVEYESFGVSRSLTHSYPHPFNLLTNGLTNYLYSLQALIGKNRAVGLPNPAAATKAIDEEDEEDEDWDDIFLD